MLQKWDQELHWQ